MEPNSTPAHSTIFTDATDATFEQEVKKQSGYVLVDMWADWCTPCHMLTPHLEKVGTRLKGKLKMVKLNTDENQRTAIEFQIMSLPTVLLFKDGAVIGQSVGFRPEPVLMQWLEERGMDISPAPAETQMPVASPNATPVATPMADPIGQEPGMAYGKPIVPPTPAV